MVKHLQRLVFSLEQWPPSPTTPLLLNPEQRHYLTRVLRLQAGDHFLALNGQGALWQAQLQGDLTTATLETAMAHRGELPREVDLVVALPKGKGFEEILRQGTELGVTAFHPIISDRTLPKPSDRKGERWQKLIQEAAEQSERPLLPQLHPVRSWPETLKFFQDLSQTQPTQPCAYLCGARQTPNPLITCLRRDLWPSTGPTPHRVIVATGPEGGWTPEEIDQGRSHQWQVVTLGDRILRAVTAPIVALSLVATILETPPEKS